jgi:UDP-arabinose 4-epimerase
MNKVSEKKKKVLVTGGAGFIGSHTAKALAKNGLTPVTIDNLENGHRWAVKWGPFYKIDIGDKEAVKKVIISEEIKSVIHFAAYAYVGESVTNPQKYFYNNVSNTISMLDAIISTGVRNIVFSSSCATYGIAGKDPIREDDLQIPINPYGESKLFIEKVLKSYGKAYGINYAVLRYFNAAGADPESEIGEVHNPETHLIPLAIGAAIGKNSGLQVFGDDYNTYDGTAVRDYIHVCDLADAHIKALDHLEAGKREIALNLGCGFGHSVHEIVKTVEKVTKMPVPHTVVQRRSGDPPILVANASLAKEVLEWKPRYPDIGTMIETAYNFFKKIEENVK